ATYYSVPGSGPGSHLSGLQAITTGPDGALWVTASGVVSGEDWIGRFDPNSLAFTDYGFTTAGVSPEGIAAGPDGAIWFTEAQGDAIGRVAIQSSSSVRRGSGRNRRSSPNE
ncbi:MAG: hypothetical protein JOY98_12360, partial [Candidatus Eremiobacteraeota bacterium]|nr:hypothetical protein [Candidatus Eremiobacteraeota bacterium]